MRNTDHNNRIYLDNAAGTEIDPDVLEVVCKYYKNEYSNPSGMYASARTAKFELEKSRKNIADLISAKNPKEIIFTSGGTESDNLAILGVSNFNKEKGKHILVSEIEHKAVLEPAKKLKENGFEVEKIPVDKTGLIDIKKLKTLLRKDTVLVSVMYVNNEIGTIQDIKKISKIIKDNNEETIFHTDACQAPLYNSINVSDLGIDMMSLNSGKIHGPKGMGLLYVNDTVKEKINPIIFGGSQEFGIRAGTENLPSIKGFESALKKAVRNYKQLNIKLFEKRDYIIKKLKQEVPEAVINGPKDKVSPHIINISILNVEGESLVLMLDEDGIEVSTGSACSNIDLKPSHVLSAIGITDLLVHSSIRISMSKNTKKIEIEKFVKSFRDSVKYLKKISSLTTKIYEK